MAMKLSEVRAKVKEVTVTWEDETVAVGYAPARLTPKVLENVAAAEDSRDLGVIGTMLSPILEWWDVLDDEGKRLGCTPEVIAEMPLSFVMAVTTALQEDQNPPASKG